jgi:hypothetical protein
VANALDVDRRVGIHLSCPCDSFCLRWLYSACPIRLGFPNGVVAFGSLFKKEFVVTHFLSRYDAPGD